MPDTPKMKLPFALERNNGQAVTEATEIDCTQGGQTKSLQEALTLLTSLVHSGIQSHERLVDKPVVDAYLYEGKMYEDEEHTQEITNPNTNRYYYNLAESGSSPWYAAQWVQPETEGANPTLTWNNIDPAPGETFQVGHMYIFADTNNVEVCIQTSPYIRFRGVNIFQTRDSAQNPVTTAAAIDATEQTAAPVEKGIGISEPLFGQTVNGQDKIGKLSGLVLKEMTYDNDGYCLPADGGQYGLGGVGANLEGLGFSWNMPLFLHGASIGFTATDDFTVLLPYSYEDSGETIAPTYPCKIAGDTALECKAGHKYVIFISAVNFAVRTWSMVTPEGVVEWDTYDVANLFSMVEVNDALDPEA